MTPLVALAGALAAVVIGGRLQWWVVGARTAPARRRTARRPRVARLRRPPRTSAEQWAAMLDAAAAETRTGTTLGIALATAMAAAPWCRHTDAPDADEAVVLQATDAARTLGGPVAATLDAAAALLRERIAIRAEASVHSAQARLSVRVLTLVPVGFCTWSLLTSASFRAAWAGPIGRVCATFGALLNLVGWAWMRRVVAGAAR